MASSKLLSLQSQIKANTADLSSYLSDLRDWESDISEKDQQLQQGKIQLTQRKNDTPPIRNHSNPSSLSSSSSSNNIPPLENRPLSDGDKKRFLEEKSLGNSAYQSNDYDSALSHYTQCIILKPMDFISYNNRAAVYLKKNHFSEAEADGIAAIQIIDKLKAANTHKSHLLKSLYRRAQARKELLKLKEASDDLSRLLLIDASNQAAKDLYAEVTLLEKKLKQEKDKEKQNAQKITNKEEDGKIKRRKLIVEEVDDDDDDDDNNNDNSTNNNKNNQEKSPSTIDKKTEVNSSTISSNISTPASIPVSQNQSISTPSSNNPSIHPSSSSPSTLTPSPSLPSSSNQNTSSNISNNISSTPSKIISSTPSVSSPSSISSHSSSSSAPSSSSIKLPRTAYEFESEYRALRKGSASLLFSYLRSLPPSQLSLLFKTALDGSLFHSIIEAAEHQRKLMIGKGGDDERKEAALWWNYLNGLLYVSRFTIAVMMMEKNDSNHLKQLFLWFKQLNISDDLSIKSTAEKYEITL